MLDHPRLIPESSKNYSKCLWSLSRVIQRVIHYKFEIIQDYRNSGVNSNLDTNLEVNSRLFDETLDLNKCLSVRSRDRVTDCMIEICQASCHIKVQVTKRKQFCSIWKSKAKSSSLSFRYKPKTSWKALKFHNVKTSQKVLKVAKGVSFSQRGE